MNAAAASDPAPAQLLQRMMMMQTKTKTKKMNKMKMSKKKKPLPQPGTWSAIETLHLIEAYEEKWYSLKRGQLRMSHWEEVAHSVACRMAGHPHPEDAISPPKSSVQCRHKLEKLRRRYRAERPLVLLKGPSHASRWPFFQRMDLMESGPHAASPPSLPPAIPVAKAGINLPARNSSRNSDKAIGLSFGGIGYVRRDPNQSTMSLEEEEEEPEEEEDEEEEEEDEEEEEEEEDSDQPPPAKLFPNSRSNSNSKRSRPSPAHLPRHIVNDDYPHYHHHNDGYGYGHMPSSNFNPKKQYVDTPISSSQKHDYARNHPRYFLKKLGPSSAELISVLRYLGEGFLRMEQMKIQLQRETELFRADMELRHTEMVLEAQKQISWEFSAALGSINKKAKKIHSTPQDD